VESDQLRRISILAISILCLSPIEFFSNKLFENKKEDNVIISYTDIKLNPNYLSNNYEIFNPNIKTTSEEIISLVSENKKKEKTESENNLESESTNEKEKNDESKETEVVEKVLETKKSTTETNVSNKTKETTNKKVEQKTVETAKVEEKKETNKSQVTSTETKAKETTVPSNTTVATELVNYAKQFVGNPYKYGGTDLYNGIDCSGFTMKIYEHFGYSLPHSSRSQSSYGSYVSTDSLMAGDLIFYGYNGSISHVAIYIGNGQIVHATTSNGGIKIASYTMMPIITARRILK